MIAAALLAGFSGAAQAENQVTMYGVVDLGLGYQKIQNRTKLETKSKIGMTSSTKSGSRFGLRGSESLGRGTSVVFTLEGGFNPSNGTHAQNAPIESRMFGRQATLGITNETWGQIHLGRQSNVASKYLSSIDPFGGGFNTAGIGYGFGSASVRLDNQVMYQTPSYEGFQASAGYSFNADFGTLTGFKTNNNPRVITTGLRYLNGPMNLAVLFDQKNAPSTAPLMERVKLRSYLLAGAIDLEIFKLAAAWGQTRNGWMSSQPLEVMIDEGGIVPFQPYARGFRASSHMLGITVPLFGSGRLFSSWQQLNPHNNLLMDDDRNSNVYSLGYSYDLTKRTNFYAYGNYTSNYAFQNNINSSAGVVGFQHRF